MLVAGTCVAVALYRVAWSARRRGHFSANRVLSLVVANAYTVLGANRVTEFACRGYLGTCAAVTVRTNYGESIPTAHAELTAAPEASKRGTTRTLVVSAECQSRFLTVTVVAVVPESYAANLAVGRMTGDQSA